ncbi:MAG: response regulator [Clostridia bacterium]|nr:response regulator [Clostridia bacterium]
MQFLLIVDDEILIADSLASMLRQAFDGRLQVYCCYSAADALEIADKFQIDLLLTDINMPDCSGLELQKRMCALYPHCRVIFLTGYSEFDYARTALDQHAFAYVLKGEGDDYVISTIERALASLVSEMPSKPAVIPETEPEQPEWLSELHSYIQDHLNSDLSLTTLADHCHFHPVYLSRIYKETTGENLSDYINQVRVHAAEMLLQNRHMTVIEISKAMGFASDNYFCRWFRKQTGKSPQSYRNSHERTHLS